jgi:dTDP-4-amino-4,6-dideoxygalactose transaminase
VWEGLTPVFADIDPQTFNIDPQQIESRITEKTSAIVPVHVFGNPCEVELIQHIANKYGLKVVYDAAHAFGVQYKEQSVLKHGDMSTISFHATKLFHTIEGGAVITDNEELANKVRLMINFGITGPESIESLGTNAKMNEFEAAMGLCVLDEIKDIVGQREEIWGIYRKELAGKVKFQEWSVHVQNHAYAPVLFENEIQLIRVLKKLNQVHIYPRRYFYPSLNTIQYMKSMDPCKKSEDIASRILCLPIYPGLDEQTLSKITEIIKAEI